MTETPIFLAVALSLIAVLFLGEVVDRLGEPTILGEVLAGIVLGTSVFGVVDPEGPFGLLATIGAMLLLFDAGYEEFDLERLRRGSSTVALLYVFGVGVPGILGGLVAITFGYKPTAAGILAIATSVTSISVTTRTFLDLDRLNTQYGNHVVGTAVTSEVTGLVLFSLVLTANQTGSSLTEYGQVLGLVAVFFLGAVLVHRFVIAGLSRFVARSSQDGAALVSVMGLLFLFGYAADTAGLDAVVGGLVAGVLVGEQRHYREVEVREGIAGIAYGLFVPLFFVRIGAQLHPAVLVQLDPLVVTAVVVGVLGKVGGGYVGGRIGGYRPADAVVAGVGMVPRAGVELVIASGALAIGIIDERMFTAVLALVVVSVLATPPVLRRAIRRAEAAECEQGDP